MFKKIFSFVCCCATPCVSFAYDFDSLIAGPDRGYNFNENSYANGLSVGTGGIQVQNDLVVGVTNKSGAVTNGYVYIEKSVANPYVITTAGDVIVDGTLETETIYGLHLDASETSGGINLTAGKLLVDSELGLINVNSVYVSQGISVAGGIWFDGTIPDRGLALVGPGSVNIKSVGDTADIKVSSNDVSGGITVANGVKILNIESGHDVDVSGIVTVDTSGELNIVAANNVSFANDIYNRANAKLKIDGKEITTSDITNSGELTVGTSGTTTNVTLEDVWNTGDMTVQGTNVNATSINLSEIGSLFNVTADKFSADNFYMRDSAVANLIGTNEISLSEFEITGDVYQGTVADTKMLNILGTNVVLNSEDIKIGRNFIADANGAKYISSGLIDIVGDVKVSAGALSDFTATDFSAKDVTNNGSLFIDANSINVNSFTDSAAVTQLKGKQFNANEQIKFTGVLYQDTTDLSGVSKSEYAGVVSDKYEFVSKHFQANGIKQNSGTMEIVTPDFKITDNIDATDLTVAGIDNGDDRDAGYLTGIVKGDVSDNVKFKSLKSLTIDGDYNFNNNSLMNVVVLNSSNHWGTLGDGDVITKKDGATSMISVGGSFISNVTSASSVDKLIELDIFNTLEDKTAIWLVHANGGIEGENIVSPDYKFSVRYCNSNGTICFAYPETARLVEETNNLWVVFDEGAKLAVYKIQPIVAADPTHNKNQYNIAGALDDVIEDTLVKNGFSSDAPLGSLPAVFVGTNMETVIDQISTRMTDYINSTTQNPNVWTRFVSLFNPREVEQAIGNIALNEHTVFRNFEDRMFDEFIWNRKRNLNKLWIDGDFGLYSHNTAGDFDVDGKRFSISAGFDWQQTKTLLLGITAHFARMNSDATENLNIGYHDDEYIAGHIGTSAKTSDFGFGAYMMQTFNQKMRLYGNAFVDINRIDVEHDQNYMDNISGDANSFALTSEWGLLHDWLNQYITGNLYARIGYNTGLDFSETSGGQDYMDFKSDGYFMFTPGYTLTFQKRIYPSAWFQIRPYASIGTEYDVAGMSDGFEYKFAMAKDYTDYKMEISRLWLNGGAGVELISSTGLQVGLDYRYQYNQVIKLHNFKISGSYRF